MEDLGKKITEHRKKLDLTQKGLGEMLNVSPQAVSKWENGQAEPDASTMKKLCAIFKISTDELLGIERPKEEAAAAADTAVATAVVDAVVSPAVDATVENTPAPAPAVERVVEQKIINGYCESCQKPVGPNEYVITHSGRTRGSSGIQHIYCNECHARMVKERSIADYAAFKKRTVKSLIFGALGGVGAGAVFAVLFIWLITLEPVWATALIAVAVGIGYFAFVMQALWDGVVLDVFSFFLHSFNLPGVIFTLDLDGLLFLLAVKIIGGIICAILSAIWFIFGLFLTPIISLVVLPFASIKRGIEGKRLRLEAQK